MWFTVAWAAERTAFVGATVYPVSGPPIVDGVVLVEGGRFVQVGPRAEVPLDGAAVVDVTGKVLVPGLVDTHSHVGAGNTGELNEGSGPLQPQVSAVDALDAQHPSFQLAQAGGVTTVNVMPGSGNLVGGQTAYLKLRDRPTIDEMLLCDDRRAVCGGLKMANGTNPQGDRTGGYPRSRMSAAAQVRQAFLDARAARPAPAKGKKAPGPPGDLGKRALLEVLDGDRTVHWHTHRADDIATIIAISREFDLHPVLHHVSEGWKVAEQIARAGFPCSVTVLDSPGGKEEAMELSLRTARALAEAGVLVAINTDDPITDSRLLLRSAALAVRGGLNEEDALAAVTLNGARMLGLANRVGSIEPGKDADLVVLSGDPFSVWTHVDQTWVEGTKVFDRADPRDHLYATGAWDQRGAP